MLAAFLNCVNYGLLFCVIDLQYLQYSDWDIEYTKFMAIVADFNLSLATIGHYILIVAYFQYGMLLNSKFTFPSD